MITDFGFFSVVASDPDPAMLVVRGRVLGDLEGFVRKLGDPVKIIHTPTADYRYRVVVSREAVASVFYDSIVDIDYPNFKDNVERIQGSWRHNIYATVWVALRQLCIRKPDVGSIRRRW